MNIGDIVQVIISNLGGMMGVAGFMLFFRETKRLKKAEAAKGEWDMWEKQLDRAEKQIDTRNQKVDSLYVELRQEQSRNLELMQENNDLKQKLKLLEIYRCEVRKCLNRQPPGDL